jgi:hypothetical protein
MDTSTERPLGRCYDVMWAIMLRQPTPGAEAAWRAVCAAFAGDGRLCQNSRACVYMRTCEGTRTAAYALTRALHASERSHADPQA